MHPYERWVIRRYLANALKSRRFASTSVRRQGDLLLDRQPLALIGSARAGFRNAVIKTKLGQ